MEEVVPGTPEARRLWLLQDDVVFLNHGSYGAAPSAVLAAQRRWQMRLEADPVHFMLRERIPAQRVVAAQLAQYLGADSAGLGFVRNATEGENAVLHSIPWREGDRILLTSQTYNAVRLAARHQAARHGLVVDEVALPLPWRGEDLLPLFRAALHPRTRLVVLDHIASPTAMVMPIAELIAALPVPVLADGAHGPGQAEVALNALGAAWYTGNAHKWLCAPKGVAFLWAAEAQRAATHPLAISHLYGQGYAEEFDVQGTLDPSAILALPAALEFRARFGGDAAWKAHGLALAREAAALLARDWRTETAAPVQGTMASLRLPLGGAATPEAARALQEWLWQQHRIEVPVMALGGALWLRISAAPYNHLREYEVLSAAVSALL